MDNPVIQTDIADVLGQINQKLDRIDDRLGKLEVGQAEIKGDLKTVDERLSGQIKALDTKVDQLDKRVARAFPCAFRRRGVARQPRIYQSWRINRDDCSYHGWCSQIFRHGRQSLIYALLFGRSQKQKSNYQISKAIAPNNFCLVILTPLLLHIIQSLYLIKKRKKNQREEVRMMRTKYFSTPIQQNSDWYFLPSMFSGTAGIIIGLVIGSVLGWV